MAKQNRWGCAGAPEQPPQHPVFFDGEEITRCPRRPILDDDGTLSRMLTTYRDKEGGYLPEPGAMDDQPHRLVNAWRIIGNVMSHVRQAKQDERRDRAGHGGPRRR